VKKLILAGALLVVIGCGNDQPQREALIKEGIGYMEEMASAMETSRDCKEAKPKLEASLGKLKEVKRREDAMGKTTKAVADSIQTKIKPDMDRISERMKNATFTLVKKDPLGFKHIEPIFQEMSTWK
jgi:hypothetical protein